MEMLKSIDNSDKLKWHYLVKKVISKTIPTQRYGLIHATNAPHLTASHGTCRQTSSNRLVTVGGAGFGV